MALKALMLRKQINDKRKALDEIRSHDADFEKREAELTAAVEEAATEEEQNAVSEEIEKFEAEKNEHEEKRQGLQKEIDDLEAALAEEEREAPVPAPVEEKEIEERKETKPMDKREKFFGLDFEERSKFFENEEVKSFLGEVRTCMKEKRSLSNVGVTIPEVMLPMIKQIAYETSKLASRVYKVSVTGTARQTIMGTIPEAVWTEMCANLNELDLGFNETEVDGYKVGGFFTVCNATLEDSDANLATELLTAIGQSIGKALDKAIVYGKGTKMPLGIVTRLAQTTDPGTGTTERPWTDLHTSHIKAGTGATGIALFKEIIKNKKLAKNDYFDQGITWLMSQETHDALIAESIDKNASAAIVAGTNGTMPVIGGEIVELPFIPEGTIVFGYMDAYLLAERAGMQLGQSEHVKFLQDQTVFKGTARYDGKPVIAEAFAVISLTTAAPATTVTFPTDTAN